jgi:AcrR family transcriptional regulator
MPRALTELEKCKQCQNLLDKGRPLVLAHGLRKVSVDDVTKAAGIAKGTFYQHFQSKEAYLYALIMALHSTVFIQVEKMLIEMNIKTAAPFLTSDASGNCEAISYKHDLRVGARGFFTRLFQLPEMAFFMRNEHDITWLLESVPAAEVQSFKQLEARLFEKMLYLAGVDTAKVKPGVVHNYIHALFLINGSELMAQENLAETVSLITDNLIAYIFGGAAE